MVRGFRWSLLVLAGQMTHDAAWERGSKFFFFFSTAEHLSRTWLHLLREERDRSEEGLGACGRRRRRCWGLILGTFFFLPLFGAGNADLHEDVGCRALQ